jgi:HAD superfamily hydrolase (TIGR01509 family)
VPVPQAVVFDLGKVLVDFDYSITARRLLVDCAVTVDQLQTAIDQSQLLHRYETGLLTSEEFFKEVREISGYRRDFGVFCDIFGDIFTPIQPMIDLHAALVARGVPTYIFSNTNELAVRHIRRHFNFFDRFTRHVLSYEHRSMKPQSRLYEVVEETTGRKGEALFYIDDRPENIAAAHARGWRAVVHETPEATIAAVKAAGLPV